MKIYIYGLKCPIAGVIRYVGKSINPEKRLSVHVEAARRGQYDHHAARWLRQLLAQSLVPELVILHPVEAGECWQDIEREFIASASMRGWKLTNSTKGGEGLDYSDPAARAIYIKNLSAAMVIAMNKPGTVAAASVSTAKSWANPDHAKRRKAGIRAAYANPAYQERRRAIARETGNRPEERAARSARGKARFANPDNLQKLRAVLNSPETKKKMSEASKAKWADPQYVATWRAAKSTPECRKKMSESAKNRKDRKSEK